MWFNFKSYLMCFYRRVELEQSLEKAQAELESLKEQRSQQIKMTESIVRQRDMYRVLLAQATGVAFPQQGEATTTLDIHLCFPTKYV